MTEKMKLTEEEIKSLKELKVEFQELTNIVGQLEVQIMDYELKKEQMKISLNKLQQREF
jgi:predicted  nucleic acid-binding Zn-ribbon protein